MGGTLATQLISMIPTHNLFSHSDSDSDSLSTTFSSPKVTAVHESRVTSPECPADDLRV
ncbi:hypothetical protein CBOM_02709 [Ceraceosorus bombacis]|uniref:Uncharacterized protein n=1 Tax=Ceraceosorus bombacis TaxID=401625 RepID=A0A0P1BFV9_9BASI|nr:hypothetical protein CBOM_02709 [Ceraceosorus bombacis]